MSTLELASIIDLVAGQLLWTTGKVALVLALAGLVLRCLPSATADTRHAIWMIAFATALLVPLVEAFGPRWHLLPAPAQTAPLQAAAISSVTPDFAALLETKTPQPSGTQPAIARSPRPAATTSVPLWQSLRWSTLLVAVWSLGLLWLASRLIVGVVSVSRLRRNTHPVGSDWDAPLQTAQQVSGVRQPPELRLAEDQSGPMLVGLRRRMVILPRDAATWTTARKIAVLQHEFAHLRRFDLETGLVAQLLCILHWLNPLVWPARRQMLFERERACDDAVLASGVSPTDYAAQILEVARKASGASTPPAAAAMASLPELESRLTSILDRGRKRRDATSYEVAGAVTLALLVGVPIASLSLTAPPALATTLPNANTTTIVEEEWTSYEDLSAIEELGVMFDAPDDRERLRAVKALGRYSGAQAVEALDAFADDPDPLVREWTARSLAMVGLRAGADTLVYLLADEEPDVREWAIRSLASVRDDRALDGLVRAMQDEVPDVREWATRTLMGYDDPEILAAMIDNLQNDDVPDVREWAARGLGNLREPAAIEALENAAFDEEPDVREWAVRGLAELDDPDAADALTDILFNGYPNVHKWAVRGLGRQSSDAGYTALMEALDSDAFAEGVRAEVIEALDRMEGIPQPSDEPAVDPNEVRIEPAPEPTPEPVNRVNVASRTAAPRATGSMDPWLALALKYVDRHGVNEDDARRLAGRAIRKRDDFLRRYGDRDAQRGAEWVEQLRERYLIGNLERMKKARRP